MIRPRPSPRAYLAAGAGLALLIALLSLHRVAGVDVWYYMAVGRWILDHAQVPRHNLFMYTAPDFPWVDHPLLAQLVFLATYRLGGAAGLEVFTAAAYAAWFGLLLWLWWRMGVGVHLALIPFLLALLLPVGRYTPRPELFTDIFLAITVALVLTWREFGHRWIWALPALVALWVNVHGGAISGVGFLLAFAGGETVQLGLARVVRSRAFPALPMDRWRTLGLVSLASAAALLLNPYGVGWFRTVSPSQIAFMAGHVAEWHPLLEPGQHIKVPLAFIFAFMALAWASFAWRRDLHLGALAAAGTFTYMAFSALRHLPICGVVLLGLMGWNLRRAVWPRFLSRLDGAGPAASRVVGVLGVLLGVAMLGYGLNIPFFWWVGAQQRVGFGIDTDLEPVAAERFIQKHGITGRMFNQFRYGGYLAWTRYPERALFIDVLDAYGPRVVSQYRQIAYAGPQAWALIDRWQIEYFLLEYPDPAGRRAGARDIHTLLSESPEWGLAYWDAISMIYLRRGPRNAGVLRRFEYRYLHPLDPLSPVHREHPEEVARELARAIATNPNAPTLRAQAARIYLQMGERDRAIAQFKQAIRLDPDSGAAHTGLGLAYLTVGDFGAAGRAFREAADLAPRDPWPHRGLAQVAEAQGDAREAARQWRKVIGRSPSTPRDRAALALAYEAAGDARRAARTWRALLARSPDPETAALARNHLAALSGSP